jgi:basic membrane protein A
MKKKLLFGMVLAFSLMLVLGEYSISLAKNTAKQSKNSAKLKIALLINGNLGDKSFFDSANHGIQLLKKEYGSQITTRVVEVSYDKTKWQPALEDLSEQNWDIIITGSFDMQEIIEKVSRNYPDKKYLVYDTTMDYSKGGYKNVYSMMYKQNEGSFLAGVLAAKKVQADLKQASGNQKMVGFLGGMDIPVINDFMVGYVSGIQYVDQDVKVAISYVGDFSNSAKGMEMSMAQYNQGAGIIFAAAGQAGLGTVDAAKKMNRYALGVDSDQSLIFEKSDPQKASLVLTSVLKNIDTSIVRAIRLERQGKLKWGTCEALGLAEDGVGIASNKYYEKNVPQEVKQLLNTVIGKIKRGEIKVPTAFGMDTAALDSLRNSVK